MTRRERDARDLIAALDSYLEARFGLEFRTDEPYAQYSPIQDAREGLVEALMRATGNPEPE